MRLSHTQLREEEIAIVLQYALRGLEYLHFKRKIHRDIKAGNILLNMEGHAKLGEPTTNPLLFYMLVIYVLIYS